MKKIKLESYISFCVFSSQKGFENRNILDQFDTKKEAKEYCKENGGGIIKAECSVTIGDWDHGPSEFGYGDTVAEARNDLKDILRRCHSDYTI